MSITSIIAQYQLQTSWFIHALDQITEEESRTTFAENLNSLNWVAGHLTDARTTIYSIISGQPINEHYKKHFGKGTPGKLEEAAPTLGQIREDWTDISNKLIATLHQLPESRLQEKPPFQTSIPDETLLGLVAYFAIHESFHIGQMAVYRKLAGKPAMAMGR